MKRIVGIFIIGCLSVLAVAEPAPQELINSAITRPWPGKNYPELPALPSAVVSNIVKEIESAPAIRTAYAKLDAAKQRNVTWFEGVAELEKEKAVWSLLSCLCHPHDDVQIHALQALANMKVEESLPFLLRYADAMSVFESGSENATLHGIIHDETAKTLAAITGLKFQMKGGQDPEGIKAAITKCRMWLREKQEKASDRNREPRC